MAKTAHPPADRPAPGGRGSRAALLIAGVIALAALGLLLPAKRTTTPAPEAGPAPESLLLRILVVETETKAADVLRALRAGEDFGALAKKESIEPSADNGGYLGSMKLAHLRAEMQDALRGLGPGDLTPVIRIPMGHAILKVLPESERQGPLAGATGEAKATDTDNAGRPSFAGIRYPPPTAGAYDADAFLRALLKPKGWTSDMKELCSVRRGAITLAVERLEELLGEPDIASKMAPHDRVQAHTMWALMEAYQGHMDRAITQWEAAYRIAQEGVRQSVPAIEEALGSAYLHKAEMDNGVYARPDDRCLFPPRAGAVYPAFTRTEASEKAIRYFTTYLEKKPADIEVKWLLNLAYMTLGRYPDGVPAPYRIARAAFESNDHVERFVDVARAAGIGGKATMAGGMVVDDFDNDGLFDMVTAGYDPCDTVSYFHNEGDGTFSDRSAAAGVAKLAGGLNIVQADYDNDGCLDVLVPRGAWIVPMPMSLLHNDCEGRFTDVTKAAGLAGLHATQAVAWADIDNDGALDLFVGDEQGKSQLFHNRGDGTFENVSQPAGIDRTAFTKGVVAEDYDNDGDADFYVSNIRGDNFLYRNDGGLKFTEVAGPAGVGRSFASFATWFFDYDNDGASDIFVTSAYASVEETMRTYLGLPHNAGSLKLYRNAGQGKFTDVTAAVGLDKVFMPMGSNFGDADGDGYLDIYLGTGAPDYGSMAPKVLMRNDGGRRFTDVTDSAGIGDLHKGHGVAFADIENDGHEDIVASMGGAVPGDAHALRLFRNPGNGNDWISLKLVGVKTNRAAIGARIKLTVENAGRAARDIYVTVNSGGSFGSSPLEQQIGLGPSARIRALEVSWPVSKTRQSFTDVAPNQFLEIRELAAHVVKLNRKSFRLRGAPSPVLGGPVS
jgi:hypothetical protein